MADVLKLQVKQPGYNEQVVTLLEELLEDARAGNISNMVCVSHDPTTRQWIHSYTGCDNLHELIGVLEKMKYIQMRRTEVE